jgi:hypothetical protein
VQKRRKSGRQVPEICLQSSLRKKNFLLIEYNQIKRRQTSTASARFPYKMRTFEIETSFYREGATTPFPSGFAQAMLG